MLLLAFFQNAWRPPDYPIPIFPRYVQKRSFFTPFNLPARYFFSIFRDTFCRVALTFFFPRRAKNQVDKYSVLSLSCHKIGGNVRIKM